ncbi:hypothetical protein UlMin_012017 [Ulmus minor]
MPGLDLFGGALPLMLIREGACYVVGDGCSIDPWKDPWVPNIPNFLPVPISEPSVSNNRVKDFFLQQGLWDFAKLAFHYSPADMPYTCFFFCDLSRRCWLASPWSLRTESLQCHSPLEGLQFLLSLEASDDSSSRESEGDRNIVLFASVLLDLIWQHINGVTHGGVIENPTIVYRRIYVVYSELLGVLPSPPPRSLLAWSPPPADWIKVNFDAAVGISGAAVACIARRSDGSVVRWASRLVNSTIPLISEGFAAELAVDLACEAQWQAVVFEGDSKSVVDSFSARSWSSFWSLSSVVQNCLFKLNSVSVWSFIFAPRACNLMAHNLARWSLNTLSSAQGASVLPSVVYSDLVVDSSL